MDPGVKSHGMKADPPRYLWSKYECFLMSVWRDIPHVRNFNAKLCSKSNERKYERTNIQTDEQKDENYIPFGTNAGGIISVSDLYIHKGLHHLEINLIFNRNIT